MATHSSILAWRIPWIEESGGLVSVQFSSVAQLCLTLWDPMDCSTSGFSVHHQLLAAAAAAKSLQSCSTLSQARTLEWVAISFSNAWKWKVKVKSFSHVRLLATPWTSAYQAPPSMGFARQEYWTNSWSLLKFMSIELVMPTNHLILCRPLLLPPSIFPSIRVFSNESVLPIRWQMHWNFSLSIRPSNEYSWLISFRIDWLDLLAVQGPFKSLLQYHSSKASILRHSAFFIVQLSHPYMTTGKTIALTKRTCWQSIVSAF